MALRVQSNLSQAISGAQNARIGNGTVRDVAQISEISRNQTNTQDNIAGLNPSAIMSNDIRDLSKLGRAANDVLSVLRTAESAASEMSASLTNMKDIATQAIEADLSEEQRAELQGQYQAEAAKVGEIAVQAQTTLGSQVQPLLDTMNTVRGEDILTALANELDDPDWLQGDLLDLSIIPSDFGDIETPDAAREAVDKIDKTIDAVSVQQTNLEETQQGADRLIEVLHEQHESQTSEKLKIDDFENANARASFVKDQIMLQPGGTMLSQAHILPPVVFAMLR